MHKIQFSLFCLTMLTISTLFVINTYNKNKTLMQVRESINTLESNIHKGVVAVAPDTGYVEFTDGTILDVSSQTFKLDGVYTTTNFTEMKVQNIDYVDVISNGVYNHCKAKKLAYLTVTFESDKFNYSDAYVLECR